MRGLVKQHIESFNYFMDHELKKIVCAKANEKVVCTTDPQCFVQYVRLSSPSLPPSLSACCCNSTLSQLYMLSEPYSTVPMYTTAHEVSAMRQGCP